MGGGEKGGEGGVKLRRAFLIGTIVAWGAFLARSVTALCTATSFEDHVSRAQIIFVGNVANVDVVSLPNTIVTRYRFDAVRYLKGQGPADSLLLVQEGGSDGRYRIITEHEISFRMGARYVVFATKGYGPTPDQYGAMPCGTGPLGIWPDSGSAKPVVHLGSSYSLVAFDGTHLVILLDHPWRPEYDIWARDKFGRPSPPTLPPRQPLPDLIRAADAEFEHRSGDLSLTPEQIQVASRRVRTVNLFPHQDPGMRVSEEDFLRTLSTVIQSIADSSGGADGRLH